MPVLFSAAQKLEHQLSYISQQLIHTHTHTHWCSRRYEGPSNYSPSLCPLLYIGSIFFTVFILARGLLSCFCAETTNGEKTATGFLLLFPPSSFLSSPASFYWYFFCLHISSSFELSRCWSSCFTVFIKPSEHPPTFIISPRALCHYIFSSFQFTAPRPPLLVLLQVLPSALDPSTGKPLLRMLIKLQLRQIIACGVIC